MYKFLTKSVPRISIIGGRYRAKWCPEEPFDAASKCSCVPCGVRVITEQTLSPLACVSLIVNVGPRYEPKEYNGITHFIEHLAYKGFCFMDRTELETAVRDMGGKLMVKTKRDMQIFSIIVPAKLAQGTVHILAKIVSQLAFPDDEICEESYNMSLERYDADRNPKAVMFDYLHATAFQGTPLAQPIIGPSQNLTNFNKCTAASFLCENYTPNRLILATSGDVDHGEISAQAASNFMGECGYNPNFGPQRYTGSQVLYRDDSMPYAHFALAVEAPGFDSPDYLKMLVMSCIAGSWHKSQARPLIQPFSIAQQVGSLGVCQSYESFYTVYKDVGLWGVYFVSEKMGLDNLVISAQDAWMRLAFMLHAGELERGKNLAKLKLAKRFDGSYNSSLDIGHQMLYTDTRWSYKSYVNQINAISIKAIKEAGEKYLCNRIPVLAGVGPTDSIPAYIRTEAGMYWLRI